ncbi:hypothetical protein PGTUg99_024904 [Puccinia graminis f. sp. tritici]|uniref:Uncharacterized protein n=1 Tax=Puccinia graminis f. sp. tritici TaxID=56615 RepID=A0A5B0RRD7_PUCGR|nr:hypothetical protein PGTUg99_024904 [Puccinia graminis f. sp. tritici]
MRFQLSSTFNMALNQSTLSVAAALAGSDNDDAQLADLAADLASQVDPVGPTSAQKTKRRP